MHGEAPSGPISWRFSVRVALVILLVAAVAFAIARRMIEARAAALRRETSNDFKHIALALHNFNDVHGHLPLPVRRAGGGNEVIVAEQHADAQPLYSWRFAIIPLVSSYYRMDAAWDQSWKHPANAKWRTVFQPFAYDSFDVGVSHAPSAPQTKTRIFAITGPGTAFGDGLADRPHSLGEIDEDTILAVEVRNSAIHWMAPGDFDIRHMPQTINAPHGRGISSRHESGFHVVFADGSLGYLSNDVPFKELQKFFTVEGAKKFDRKTILGPYADGGLGE